MTEATAGTTRSQPGLLKVLGVAFGLAMIVGNTIGSGILRTPGDVAASLPSSTWFLGVWIACGLYAMCGAMTMAELTVALPKSGGQYVYARRAIGEYAGFVIGWTDWLSCAAALAGGAIALGELAGSIFPALASQGTVVAVVATLAFTGVHWVGVRSGNISQQALSLIKTVALLGVAIACLLGPAAPVSSHQSPVFPTGVALTTALVLAFQNVLYTYDGWNGVVYFGGEIKDPVREVPKSMALGVVAVAAVYLSLNFAFVHSLGIDKLAGEKFAAAAAARVAFGEVGERIVNIVMAFSILGLINALIMQTCRVPHAMADDGLLPKAIAKVNAGGTPHVSLAFSTIAVLVMILSGTFATMVALAAFYYVMQYAVTFASVFILRRSEPELPRPYRAWGYPWITGLVLTGALAFVIGSFFFDRENTLHSVYVLVASLPLFLVVKRFRGTVNRQ